MRILAIETATAACSVALIDNGTLVAERHEIVGRGHAERLIPMIAELPDGGRADIILVDCGPGSFTGVRVGLAAARALGLAWGVAVRGFSSLALVAAAAAKEGGSVAVALTGGHGELFVQRFAADPLAPLAPLASLPPELAAAQISEPRIHGSGAAALIAARGFGEAQDALPRAADLLLLPEALASLAPAPLYGRAPDAKLPS
ncbi:tRNA (adenosine(37)-N6)-threonylcarbamoyltransferase complex dimerization subunit type 1 TsaB [Sphingomonas oleivorans]|uniref:tRNA (adenosine(37)-N6)-threonylcarbamoyltransferase complex dimerization subunit type 1 TsaB n=1 Tax=Sphingomonas oleivorans TaxID=1735121 RepID=UPI001FAF529E|nr:tRNA (adenosine(37)-N6)-threonylcarbamoyltransferase complex dimerization subunit type 1 TsaB [Sphingomonas oleivorans]